LPSLNSADIAQAVIFVGMFLLISGPVHECAHAFVAWRLGDGTAKLFGRISLNPVRHFDPIGGTLLAGSVFLSLIAGGAGIGFGWAKPTPVNPYNLRGRHADSFVAAAGPLSNLVLAVLFAAGFQILHRNGIDANNTSAINMVQLVFQTGIILNVMLMIFNLLPIPPLDGSHVLFDLLDPRTSQQVRGFMNQYGIMILVLVIFFGGRLIFSVVGPVVNFLAGARIY
jgi:Zn-dependent protease